MRAVRYLSALALALSPVLATAEPVQPVRPAADIARDTARKPAEMVRFAGIRRGQTVVDLLPGGGYFTRIFSAAVGLRGRVIALIPAAHAARAPDEVTKLKALAAEPGYGNVAVVVAPLSTIAPAGTADVVWTAQNYHDLHNPALPADTVAGVNKAVFEALKPGGVYLVVDHAAAAGSSLRDVDTLHRIDPAVVKAEVMAAGFVFDSESLALASAADDHTKVVFDPAIRGRTDQFTYRFRKPR